MTRNFDPDRPVPAATLRHLVDLASRAPSAGKTQGWHLLVLEGADTAMFWDITLPADRRAGFAWPGLLVAPVLSLVLADPQAYVDRYAEPDKAATGWGTGTDAWSAPYWTIDTAMAAMTLLLAAEDAGLGTLFFAVSRNEDLLRERLGIPAGLEIVGAIAMGYPAQTGEQRSGRSVNRRRRPPEEILHFGRW